MSESNDGLNKKTSSQPSDSTGATQRQRAREAYPQTRGIPRAPLPPEAPTARTTTAQHTRAGRALRRRPWIAFGLSIATLFMASWIFIPGPNRTFLTLSVGTPEISIWLILASIVAIVGAIRTWKTHVIARVTTVIATVALIISLTPLARFYFVSKQATQSLRESLGEAYLDAVPLDRQLKLSKTTLSFGDWIKGFPSDSAIVSKSIAFATVEGITLRTIVYRPPVRGTYPVVVQIYGGAWQRGTPDDFAEFARFLAARGYVVFSIDYRHAPAFHYPAPINDVKTALAWIRKNAATYGADVSRIALLGRSAGAHLALMAAYDSTLPPVKAVVGYYAPADLVDAYQHPASPDPLNIRDVIMKLMGAPLEAKSSEYAEASPINHVRAGLPPTLLLNGARDKIVEARFGTALNEKLRASGDTSILVMLPWADHAFDEVSNGPSGQLSRYVTERFLAWALTQQHK